MPKLHRGLLAPFILGLPSLLAQVAPSAEKKDKPTDENIVVMEKFVAGGEALDPKGIIPKGPTDAVFGIAKTAIETPRSLTLLSGEMIEQFSVVELPDLVRFVPSAWSGAAFGIPSTPDIRGDSGDVYFRGVKRLSGGVRVVIGASDGVMIVRGPPSAIFGNGRVGGYMDYLPKSARARTGKYLPNTTGKTSVTLGSYGKQVVTGEIGGPLTLFGKRAGFYLYGQWEESDSFYIGSYTREQLAQGTLTIDLTNDLRIESGFNFQNNRGTGVAGWNRITQDLIDNGNYIAGIPLHNIDTNGDGGLSRAELLAEGGINFNIPFQGARPPLPRIFQLDPATIRTVNIDRRLVLLERKNATTDYIGFIDLINDANRDLVFKQKLFFEYQDGYKFSDTSTSQLREQTLMEAKSIVEYTPRRLPEWLRASTLLAANVRYLDTYNESNLLNQNYPRVDVTRPWQANWIVFPHNTHRDLAGVETATKSANAEYGLGGVADLTFFNKTNLMLNVRHDYAWAEVLRNQQNFLTVYDLGRGTDDASSYSISVSHEIIKGVRPYYTYAKTKTTGSGAGVSTPAAARTGSLSVPSKLEEVGVKTSHFNDRLFTSLAVYRQFRSSFNSELDTDQQTRSEGYEADIRWVPTRRFNLTAAGAWSKVVLDPITRTTAYRVLPQWAGYGPAYGGRVTVTLPALADYAERSGKPDKVLTLNANYAFDSGWDISGGAAYQAGTSVGDLKDIQLPDALTFSGSIGYRAKKWHVRLSGSNLTDEWYFRGNTNHTILALPSTGRMFDVKVTTLF